MDEADLVWVGAVASGLGPDAVLAASDVAVLARIAAGCQQAGTPVDEAAAALVGITRARPFPRANAAAAWLAAAQVLAGSALRVRAGDDEVLSLVAAARSGAASTLTVAAILAAWAEPAADAGPTAPAGRAGRADGVGRAERRGGTVRRVLRWLATPPVPAMPPEGCDAPGPVTPAAALPRIPGPRSGAAVRPGVPERAGPGAAALPEAPDPAAPAAARSGVLRPQRSGVAVRPGALERVGPRAAGLPAPVQRGEGRVCPACGRPLRPAPRDLRGNRLAWMGSARFELTARCWYENRAHGRDGRPLPEVPSGRAAGSGPPGRPDHGRRWCPVVGAAPAPVGPLCGFVPAGALLFLVEPAGYRVVLVPGVTASELVGSWDRLARHRRGRELGRAPAAAIRFDAAGLALDLTHLAAAAPALDLRPLDADLCLVA